MANNITSPSKWSIKQYILAALTGILAINIVVIIVAVILRPAHLGFSVISASSSASDGGISFNLTLAANNTSQRARVEYGSIDVQLWYNPTNWYTASVETSAGPQNTTSITASVFSLDHWPQLDRGGKRSTPFRVVVIAEVRFDVGLVCTRWYTVRVLCYPVDFFGNFTPVSCSG